MWSSVLTFVWFFVHLAAEFNFCKANLWLKIKTIYKKTKVNLSLLRNSFVHFTWFCEFSLFFIFLKTFIWKHLRNLLSTAVQGLFLLFHDLLMSTRASKVQLIWHYLSITIQGRPEQVEQLLPRTRGMFKCPVPCLQSLLPIVLGDGKTPVTLTQFFEFTVLHRQFSSCSQSLVLM